MIAGNKSDLMIIYSPDRQKRTFVKKKKLPLFPLFSEQMKSKMLQAEAV